MTTRSRSISSGQSLRTGRLRVKARTVWVFAVAAAAASPSLLATETNSSSFCSNWLVDQTRRALRARPIDLAL